MNQTMATVSVKFVNCKVSTVTFVFIFLYLILPCLSVNYNHQNNDDNNNNYNSNLITHKNTESNGWRVSCWILYLPFS